VFYEKNTLFFTGMLAVALVFGLALAGCENATSGGGGGGGAKPATLSSTATAAQAYDKLDEIIAYSGTPSGVKASAQTVKATWSPYYYSAWSTYGPGVITSINSMIASIP
jgi:hypothetical protein